ncbi:Microtubule-associated protein RP/EB family member 1 [Gracilariopsis chorda]|uniref:Microtubule-associated protein RP/EB family member 1 n=1 Tax=Gracilariopsis chorda TaxID=448386 RepID=A0A2V3J4U1_9FLOR|nr:Microtubule-associated protein RP/EB family member 1 [Gracilariopsis chorda]|eukprot:PXF48390.1 Microtubule-associated protein RP/EB family member 1 [Gracilariopsis chorda]
MQVSGDSIGMMAGAYFVGRNQLLRWINELTGLNYTKIEQTASGVFACHVFDALFPGNVKLEKVKFNAKHSHEFIHNYKILQAAFNCAKLRKRIDVEKLIKAKYQDNLEFIQWIKAFYDAHASEEALNYDGRSRRESIMQRPAAAGARSGRTALAQNRPRLHEGAYGRERNVTGRAVAVRKAEFDALKEENEKLKNDVADCEADREFYFSKLRDVEVIIQGVDEKMKNEAEAVDLTAVFKEIRAVLYAEDGGADEDDDQAELDELAEEAQQLQLEEEEDAEYDA